MSYKHDVCIVGLKCRDLLVGADMPRYLGGIERMLVALARGLDDAGHRVAFITFDETRGQIEDADGITIFPAFDPEAGIRGIRAIHPKLTSLTAAMKRADAPVYLQMGAGIETTMTLIATRLLRRRMVFCLASDSDSLPETPLIYSDIESKLYKWALRRADDLVSQTIAQEQMLKTHYGLPSTIIPMPHHPTRPPPALAKRAPDDPRDILWVGRIVEGKRLERYVDVAERMPEYQFHVVGSPNQDSAYSQSVVDRARNTPNVNVHGRVGEEELFELYCRSGVLCCTSEIEGFPATFIEAWSFGMPVVTTFDPDGVVTESGLGLVVDTVDEIETALRRLFDEPDLHFETGSACRTYYENNFTTAAVVPQFAALMCQ